MTPARLLLFATALVACAAGARADALDDYARGQMKELHLPGLAAAVLRNGEVTTLRTWGAATLEPLRRITADTEFELGSLSKQFTAVAVMMLVEEKALRLDDEVTRLLPGAPASWRGITVRHLLTHSSGLQEYLAVPPLAEKVHAAADHDEIARLLFEGLEIQFRPGESWAYSNSGYLLLGIIVERASGRTYCDFLDERIFRPLGMTATRARHAADTSPGRAAGYAWEGGAFFARGPVPANAFAAGAIVSTLNDMTRWERALTDSRLLTEDSWGQVWTPLTVGGGATPPFSYGFGWVVDRDARGAVVLHSGGTPGFSSAIRRSRGSGVSVVLLTNRGDTIIDHLAAEIAAIVAPAGATRGRPRVPRGAPDARKVIGALMAGRVDDDAFTSPMRIFLGTDAGRGMWQWIASHGRLRSLRLTASDPAGRDTILRYRARLGRAAYRFSVTLTPEGKIAQIYWW